MLPWNAEPGKARRRSSATQNHGAFHLFHPPFGFHRVPVPWQQLRCALWWRHLSAVKICISQTQQGALYISPAVPRGRQGGVKNRKHTYSNKEQKKKEKSAWWGSAALSQPERFIFTPVPPSANLLSPSTTALGWALPPFLQLHRAQGSFSVAVQNAGTRVPG